MPGTEIAQWHLEVADGAATGAVLAHVGAVGLLEVIDRFRFRDAGDPIAAPESADLPGEIRAHALDAIHAASSCRILVDDLVAARHREVPESGDDDPPGVLEHAIEHASRRAQEAALRARRGLRHLAQIGLGVAQHAYEDDDVELLERTVIGVLLNDDTGTPATADRLALTGRTRAEVSVELAGLIARMLCDRSTGADPSPGFALAVDGTDDLVVEITETGGVDVRGIEVFEHPVTITEVTTLLLKTIGDEPVEALALHWPSDPSPAES